MAYYFLAHFTVHDVETYRQFPPAVVPSIVKHGGKVLSVTSQADIGVPVAEPKVAEGSPQHLTTVIVEFPTYEAYDAWYHSNEFQTISEYRTSASTGWALGLPGFVPPDDIASNQ